MERMQEKRVNGGEDGGVDANTYSQGRNRYQGEQGIPGQDAQRKAELRDRNRHDYSRGFEMPLSASQSASRCGQAFRVVSLDRYPMLKPWPPRA